MKDGNGALPAYAATEIKARLLAEGASGTIYAMVMPESEAGIQRVVDGCDVDEIAEHMGSRAALEELSSRRDRNWLSLFREPWTEQQNDMHVEYFEQWIEWASPIVSFDPTAFPFRYPTAGASQGIEKLLAEYITRAFRHGKTPVLHVFEGEYEGFAAYAKGLSCEVHVHRRSDWRGAVLNAEPGFFFVSQPSAIDGMVWEDFDAFCAMIDDHRMSQIEVVPDLTYVGSTAREWKVSLDHHCIRAFVISHSKPFGLYYHRVGGVFAREERPTLFGNVWFKNLTSIRIGIEMMKSHHVFELPRKYLDKQKEAVLLIARRLKLDRLSPADINVMAQAPIQKDGHPLSILERGCEDERVIRVCLTPQMTTLVDPDIAPTTAMALSGIWDDEETNLVEIRTPHASDGAEALQRFQDRFEEALIADQGVRIVLNEGDLRQGSIVRFAHVDDVWNRDIAEKAAEVVLQADDGTVVLLKGFDA